MKRRGMKKLLALVGFGEARGGLLVGLRFVGAACGGSIPPMKRCEEAWGK